MRKPFWTKQELADLKKSEEKQAAWLGEGCISLGIGCLTFGVVSCFLPFLLLLK